MIDLHLHLLPGVDDGAATIEISRAMLERAELLGFTSLVATPHLSGRLAPAYDEKVRAALSSVRQEAEAFAIAIAIELGYEIQLSPDLPDRLQRGERSRLADSTTVLVELPFAGWPLFTESVLFDLQTMGLRPLLAHPERYAAIQADISKGLELAERGVLMQITAGSVAGLFGKPAQRVAEQFLRQGAVTVLASDAHSAGQRFVSVADGIARTQSLIGPARTQQLIYDNPKALLESRPLPRQADIVAEPEAGGGWKKAISKATGRLRR